MLSERDMLPCIFWEQDIKVNLTIYQEIGGKDVLHIYTVKLPLCQKAELVGKLKGSTHGDLVLCHDADSIITLCLVQHCTNCPGLSTPRKMMCCEDGLLVCYLHLMLCA